jgi:hypothetical protein
MIKSIEREICFGFLKNIFKVSKHFKISHFSDLAISSRVLGFRLWIQILILLNQSFSHQFKFSKFIISGVDSMFISIFSEKVNFCFKVKNIFSNCFKFKVEGVHHQK